MSKKKSTYKIPLAVIGLSVLVFVASLYVHDRVQVRQSIVDLKQTIAEERVARKCSETANRLIYKIDAMKKFTNSGNVQISIDIIASYGVALDLADKNDIRCVIMEEMGDSMLRAYKAGVKNGTKNSYF